MHENPSAILSENKAEVVCIDEYWYLTWWLLHDSIDLGAANYLSRDCAEQIGAVFIHLWLKGVEKNDAIGIAKCYGYYHNWFGRIQKVYQLRAVGAEPDVERVSFSEKVWYSREEAEKQKDNFAQSLINRGVMSTVTLVDIITLEIPRRY